MRKRLVAGGTAVIALPIALLVATTARAGDPLLPREFCNSYAVIVDADPIEVGGYRLLVDQPLDRRDRCDGEDLWHFPAETLAEIDGVMFSNCEISWVSGGRSSAGEIDVPCEPS